MHFFENLPFLDPHLFWLTSRIFADTFFVGTDKPPLCASVFLHLILPLQIGVQEDW